VPGAGVEKSTIVIVATSVFAGEGGKFAGYVGDNVFASVVYVPLMLPPVQVRIPPFGWPQVKLWSPFAETNVVPLGSVS
jgi:hypothetical protein